MAAMQTARFPACELEVNFVTPTMLAASLNPRFSTRSSPHRLSSQLNGGKGCAAEAAVIVSERAAAMAHASVGGESRESVAWLRKIRMRRGQFACAMDGSAAGKPPPLAPNHV
mmetsp:Transcript_139354/g.347424  ORF Transcript_139354/g.347424 Transcript_139354/m.347424 type:complete len:113 (-) Transcript_139354:160-498(-)